MMRYLLLFALVAALAISAPAPESGQNPASNASSEIQKGEQHGTEPHTNHTTHFKLDKGSILIIDGECGPEGCLIEENLYEITPQGDEEAAASTNKP